MLFVNDTKKACYSHILEQEYCDAAAAEHPRRTIRKLIQLEVPTVVLRYILDLQSQSGESGCVFVVLS